MKLVHTSRALPTSTKLVHYELLAQGAAQPADGQAAPRAADERSGSAAGEEDKGGAAPTAACEYHVARATVWAHERPQGRCAGGTAWDTAGLESTSF